MQDLCGTVGIQIDSLPVGPREHFLHQETVFSQPAGEDAAEKKAPGPENVCNLTYPWPRRFESYLDDRAMTILDALLLCIEYLLEVGSGLKDSYPRQLREVKHPRVHLR